MEAAKGTLQALEEDISLRKNRAAKLMFILERRNREWDFISRRRRIFNEWRKEAQKQKGFFTLDILMTAITTTKKYLVVSFLFSLKSSFSNVGFA